MLEPKKEDTILTTFLWILVITAFTTGIVFEGPSFSFNLSQITAIILFFFLIIYHAINRRQIILLYKDGHALFIYLYFFSNVFSSLIFSPVLNQSLKACVLILSYVFIYITVRWAVTYIIDQGKTVRRLMKFNNLSALFGLACMGLSLSQGGTQNIGVSLDHLGTAGIPGIGSLPSIRSLSMEPNVFAIATATILCINLSIYLLWRKSNKQLFIITLLSLSILFSYTRSVYFSLFLALFVLLIVSRRIKLLVTLINYFVVVVIMVTVLMLSLPKENSIKKALVARSANLFDFKSGSGRGRVEGLMIGLDGLRESPVFGLGTLSADTRFYNPYTKQYQERMGSAGWLNGVLIQSLHDTGLVGAIIIIGLFTSIMLSNYRLFKQLDNASIEKSIILGFLGGNIILFIASQTSSTLWLSFPYIYWGINMGVITWCKKRIRQES